MRLAEGRASCRVLATTLRKLGFFPAGRQRADARLAWQVLSANLHRRHLGKASAPWPQEKIAHLPHGDTTGNLPLSFPARAARFFGLSELSGNAPDRSLPDPRIRRPVTYSACQMRY